MKTVKGVLLFVTMALGAWGCSDSSTSQEPDPQPYPPDAISHLPLASEIVAQDSLYTITPDSLLTASQKKQLADLVKSNKYYLSAHLAQANPKAIALLKQADTLAFPISEDSAYVAIKHDLFVGDSPSPITWEGKIPPRSLGRIHLLYSLQNKTIDGYLVFQMPFIIAIKFQEFDDNTFAVIKAKRPPFQNVRDVVL